MTDGRRPFQLVSWHGSFLEPLIPLLCDLTDGKTGRAIVVFPHDRPRRYLTKLFASASGGAPLILPRMLTSRELFRTIAVDFDIAGGTMAGALDRTAILWDCAHTAKQDGSMLSEALGRMTEADFFPWGTRLANLLEECLTNALTPTDLRHTEGEVSPFAAALLASLRDLYTGYRKRLESHGLMTPGLEAALVTEHLREHSTLPSFLDGRHLILAGFGALNGTEEAAFRFLWEHGATVCLHGDPALAGSAGHPHHACSLLARWMKKWGASCELVSNPPQKSPRIRFFAGHDLHSQLAALREDMEALPPAGSDEGIGRAAVALPHPGALLPVLHHLPSKDCNVSLGYPLRRSLLAQLIDAILRLRDSRREDGTCHWRPLLEILRHPYLRMLAANGQSAREALSGIEKRLRAGHPFAAPEALAEETLTAAPPDAEVAVLVRRIIRQSATAWGSVSTPAEMAARLEELCGLLLEAGGDVWTRFPLDAEGLFRLHQRVIPTLRDNLMSEKNLPWPLLHQILEELLQEERIPFEADPLTGIQVLGMLETRLLRFAHVFVVDVTEDHLPGIPAQDPLLPDTLRGALGLPDASQRDTLSAYTFRRLLMGASTVNLYWQEGISSGKLFDGRKQRSRFIEELIWEEERRRGKLLKRGTAPLYVPDIKLVPPHPAETDLLRSPVLNIAMKRLLAAPLSPTELDAYLACPLRFYYERLCRLAPLKEVDEGDDMAGVGSLLHKTLCDAYTPWIGRQLRSGELTPEKLADVFFRRLEESDLPDSLLPENLVMLRVAGPERLRRYLASQPETTRILELETRLDGTLEIAGIRYHLRGVADRIDQREEGVVVLDYKTGKPREARKTFWTDEKLWEEIDRALNTSQDTAPDTIADPDLDLLPRIAGALPTLQLPAYLYMLRSRNSQGADAAFVDLGESGAEMFLLPPDAPETLRSEILCEKIPALLRFVLLHMDVCPAFRARPDRHCSWCSSARFCLRSRQAARAFSLS